MEKQSTAIIGGVVLLAENAHATNHWGDSGHEGQSIGEIYHLTLRCAPKEKTNHLPISLARLSHNYSQCGFPTESSSVNVENNSHTIKASNDSGSSITVDGHTIHLVQTHRNRTN